MKSAVITVGMGWGDEGKGSCVDFLSRTLQADLVVRYSGGSQCGHNVQLPDGKRHTFSQFGAGTFAGVKTYLGSPVIINPPAMVREANHLIEMGVKNPFEMLTIHPKCLVTTVYHQRANHAKELARGSHRHGSCGHGIGETRNYWLKYGEDAIFAEDLQDKWRLGDKLELMRQRILNEFSSGEWLDKSSYAHITGVGSLKEDLKRVSILDIMSSSVAEKLNGFLGEGGSQCQIAREIPDYTTAVFEGAQGVLLDEWYGFHPYTTWSTVTPHFGYEMAKNSGAKSINVLGITRTYLTRHGAGPFPTYDEKLSSRLTDEGNLENEWQGKMRCGDLDLVLLKYAIAACGGIDNLAINHFDQVDGLRICDKYSMLRDEESFRNPLPNLSLATNMQCSLNDVEPMGWHVTAEGLRKILSGIAPIAIEGFGPTHLDKKFYGLTFNTIP